MIKDVQPLSNPNTPALIKQRQAFKANAAKYGFPVALAAAASNANAAGSIDITPITDLITAGVTAAVAIGLAYLGYVAGISIYKKLRSAA